MRDKEYIERGALRERLEIVSVVADDLYGMGINAGLDRADKEVFEMPAADVVDAHGAEMRQLWYAVYALADMVCQFGYSTTFRRQNALCDAGLSSLERAFSALTDCGCPTNSNGTITVKKLWEFMDKIDGKRKEQTNEC